MRINWKKFASLFVLFNLSLICVGCTAAWIGAISALLPAIQAAVTAILSFVLSLEGKTVPASVTAAIQKIVDGINTELQNLTTLIAAAKAGGTTVLSQIGAVLNSILANLGSILSGLNVSDSSTLQKITELVGLAVAAVQAILAIIPLAEKKLAENPSAVHLEAFDKATANQLSSTHKAMQETYKAIVGTTTESMDVNTALAALPKTLP